MAAPLTPATLAVDGGTLGADEIGVPARDSQRVSLAPEMTSQRGRPDLPFISAATGWLDDDYP